MFMKRMSIAELFYSLLMHAKGFLLEDTHIFFAVLYIYIMLNNTVVAEYGKIRGRKENNALNVCTQ